MALPYESDLLLAIALGVQEIGAATSWTGCTAAPFVPRRFHLVPDNVRRGVAAFSVVVAWAMASDAERDDGLRRARWLRKRLDPRLEDALECLGIESGRVPDPRLLAGLDEEAVRTLPGFLGFHQPFVGGLWQVGMEACGVDSHRERRWITELSTALGDCMVLTDAAEDVDEDTTAGRWNPAASNKDEVRSTALARLRTVRCLLSDLAEPWRGVALSMAGSSVLTRLPVA